MARCSRKAEVLPNRILDHLRKSAVNSMLRLCGRPHGMGMCLLRRGFKMGHLEGPILNPRRSKRFVIRGFVGLHISVQLASLSMLQQKQ